MAFEESPSLDKYSGGIPPRTPSSSGGRRWLWVCIAILAVAAVALIALDFLRSNTTALLVGTGTVVGKVVDESDKPLVADVFVLRTDIEGKTDATGAFEISGVPAGAQVIVVAYGGAGREYPVTVTAGAIADVGRIRLTATVVPQ